MRDLQRFCRDSLFAVKEDVDVDGARPPAPPWAPPQFVFDHFRQREQRFWPEPRIARDRRVQEPGLIRGHRRCLPYLRNALYPHAPLVQCPDRLPQVLHPVAEV